MKPKHSQCRNMMTAGNISRYLKMIVVTDLRISDLSLMGSPSACRVPYVFTVGLFFFCAAALFTELFTFTFYKPLPLLFL